MKKVIVCLLFIISTTSLFAQAPDWQWATQAGGSSEDSGRAIAIDDNGNSYVTGKFRSTAAFGSYSLTSNGFVDIFVAKMDANGNWLWAAQAGGTNNDYGQAIAIDDNGNSYVTGYYLDTATFGSYSLTSNGSVDIFVAKMDANGNWLWAAQAGGSGSDYCYGIAIDDSGSSYVTGYFWDTATFGSYSLISSGTKDIYIAKMDANGNWLWAAQAGGSSEDSGRAIATDDSGNSYVSGNFKDTATFGSYSLTSSGYDDIFTAKIDAIGNWLWATKAGGSGSDHCYGIAIDDSGSSYVTGNFQDTATFGSYSLTSSGYNDIFAAKIGANSNWLWATKAGGSDYDVGNGIVIDNNGNNYVTGFFEGSATFGSYSPTSSGDHDIFIAKLGNDTSVEKEIIPTNLKLSNYPNPFNPSTTIEFSIQKDNNVELSIFNIKGQKIKTLVQNEFTKGSHSVIWEGTDQSKKSVSSGVYLYKLNVNGKTEVVKKCLLLK